MSASFRTTKLLSTVVQQRTALRKAHKDWPEVKEFKTDWILERNPKPYRSYDQVYAEIKRRNRTILATGICTLSLAIYVLKRQLYYFVFYELPTDFD